MAIAVLMTALTFGQPLLFDRLYLLVLACAAGVTLGRDKNLCTVILILFAQRSTEELLWLIKDNSWLFKLLVYAICAWACYRLRYDRLARLSMPVLALLLISEAYWLYSAYPAPMIAWLAVLITSSLLTRHALYTRPALMCAYLPRYFKPENVRWLALDFQLHQVIVAFMLLAYLNIGEYLVRHLFGQSHILVVYSLTPYAAQALSGLVLWYILNQTLHLITKQQLDA